MAKGLWRGAAGKGLLPGLLEEERCKDLSAGGRGDGVPTVACW